jgi:hypothetical protein
MALAEGLKSTVLIFVICHLSFAEGAPLSAIRPQALLDPIKSFSV